jgi:hypothetical protein
MGTGGNKIGKDVLHDVVHNIINNIILDLLRLIKMVIVKCTTVKVSHTECQQKLWKGL